MLSPLPQLVRGTLHRHAGSWKLESSNTKNLKYCTGDTNDMSLPSRCTIQAPQRILAKMTPLRKTLLACPPPQLGRRTRRVCTRPKGPCARRCVFENLQQRLFRGFCYPQKTWSANERVLGGGQVHRKTQGELLRYRYSRRVASGLRTLCS